VASTVLLTVLAVQSFFIVLLIERHKQWLVVPYSRHPHVLVVLAFMILGQLK